MTRELGIDDPYRRLVEVVHDYAIFLLDPEGRVATWNPGAERMKGYRSEEILGQHFSRFYPKEAVDRRWPQQELELAAARGRFEEEGWRLRKDGSRFWASVVITALRDERGELRGFGKITRDLTERRRHEESVRHSEERFRLLVEAVKDYAIFMLDGDGRVVSWNPGAARITGYGIAEVLGQHLSLFYPEESRRRRWPEQQLVAAREHGRSEDESLRVRKDGSTFWAHAVMTPVLDAGGALRGYAKVVRDLTDRKRIEALEKAERQNNEFLAMLAHELRNPLAPISNALNLLARKPTSDPAELWVREVLTRQTGQMARLVDDLLDVSRITRAAVVLDKKPADLRSIVRNAADASRQWFEERGHAFDVSLPEERLMVEADEVRLNQVVQNLLHNAAKYTPGGGRITLAVARAEGYAVVRVRDNGVGMSPELLTSAFDLFRQGSQGLERTQGGLGVGLTLVQRLITLHGGAVEARSDGAGKGSEFVVRLPLREEPAIVREAAPSAQPPVPRGPARRILIVDDNRDATQALRLLLEADGHEVRVADDGASGLEMARAYRPEVALLDIGLPKIDGYELARRVRSDPALERTVLVAVTGYGQMHDRARASASGFHRHLVKPVAFSALQEVLRELA